MNAVVNLDPQSQNLTLAYQSSLTRVQAQGYYRNTPNEKLINFGLDINGQKHIDIQLGVEISGGPNGKIYSPKLLFAINNKRIVSLSGNIAWVVKTGISQCHIELDLQTNRFATIISGYGRLSDVSVATNMRMDYRFGNGTNETVRFEIQIGNKSTKFLTSYLGLLQLETTAYPEINLHLVLTFQKAQSHTDCHLNMVTNPYVKDSRQKLRVMWHYQLYKAFAIDKRNVTIEITRPVSGIDLKLAFFKQTTGSNSTSIVLIKYSKGKEVVITYDINTPSGKMFFFENRLKVSIPAASEQMSLHTKIFEKSEKDYDIEFIGVWFSGHNITVRGMYQDRSDDYTASHSIKLLTRSQFFNDLLISGRILNKEQEIKTDLQVEHNEIAYGIGLHHKSEMVGTYETFGEILYDTASYSFISFIDLILRKAQLDLHLDTFRDVHIACHGQSNKTVLDAGIDIKWDANRDPSQKFDGILLLQSLGNLNHEGTLFIEYPGRIVRSSFVIQHKSVNYLFSGKVEWSPEDIITAYFNCLYDFEVNRFIRVEGNVDTPFKNWEHTSANYQIKVNPQNLKSNGSLIWQSNQKVDLEISYGYNFTQEENFIAIITQLNSSIPEISSMQGIFKYQQIINKFMTEFVLQSSPINMVAINLNGEIVYAASYNQYQINFGLATPFEVAKRASILGNLYVYPKRKFKGQLQLIGNVKKYITTVDGSFQYLKESKFNFHIATPFDKYKLINGRYAFSASNKYFIIELKGPTVSAGAEIIYAYNNLTNFDLKLKAHTSAFVKNILLVGKRDSDTLDIRLGWNTFMVGLIGRSHYLAWNDVDYSLQIFTPFEGYTKGSAIAKLIYKDKLDLEVYVNAGDKKIGLKVQGKEHPEQDFAEPYTENILNRNPNKTYLEPFNYDEIEYGNTYWRGIFQFDSALYPTVHGFVQINEDGSEYTALSFISFPFGQMKIIDNLKFKDSLNLENILTILTTCKCLEEGVSNFVIEGIPGRHISSSLDVSTMVFNTSYEGILATTYDYVPVSEENYAEGHYNITIRAKTPFHKLMHGYSNVLIQAVSPVYVGNVTAEINNSTLYFDGTLENDGDLFISDLGVQLNLTDIDFKLPMCRLLLSKDFTDFEKEIKVGIALPNEKGVSLVNYGVAVAWHYEGPKYMKYVLSITTPYPAVGTIKTSAIYSSSPKEEEYFLELYLKYARNKEISAWNSVRKDMFNFHVLSTHDAFRNLSINGTLKSRGYVRSLDAVFSLDKQYKMHGSATINPKKPFIVDVKLLKASTNEEEFGLSLTVQKRNNRYDISSLIQRFHNRINILCDYVIVDNVGKLLYLMLSSNYPGYEKAIVFGEFLGNDYKAAVTKINGDIVSRWITTQAQLNFNVSLDDDIGLIKVQLINKNITVDGKVDWVNRPMDHMAFDISAVGSYRGIKKSLNSHFHFWNKDKFKEMSYASDINYNSRQWWISTNATLLWPCWNDLEFVSHAILPHKIEDHHITLVKLFHEKDFNYSAIVLKYFSNPKHFNFEALTEIAVGTTKTSGVVLLNTGKHRIYDKMILLYNNKEYDISNLLQSTNIKEDLITEITYRKPAGKHNVKMQIYYPKPNSVMDSTIEFSSLNVLDARLNCSTPFKTFPHIRVFLTLKTNRTLYQRYGEVLWSNQSALFNYTHASTWNKDLQLTNGNILIDFPLTSRHTGLLNYKYESTKENALGRASLTYNSDDIMSGNYSRNTQFTEKNTYEVIKINASNSYLPLGIIYINDFENKSDFILSPKKVFKRIELYKLYDSSGFNLTGDIEVIRYNLERNVTLRVLHSHRKLVIDTVYDGNAHFNSIANFTLRPNFWTACGFDFNKKDIIPGRNISIFVAYPRRYLTAQGYYDLNDDDFVTEISMQPNRYKSSTQISGLLIWKREPQQKNQNITFILGHPSFVKNLTFHTRYSKSDEYPTKLEADFEYSTDINKKLSFYSFLRKKSLKPTVHYEYNAYGDHPASRLKITGFGYLKMYDKVIDFKENITYKRSYQPLSYWYNGFMVNFKEKMLRAERSSLRDFSFIEGAYRRVNTSYYVNGTLINGKDVHITGNFYLDPQKHQTRLKMNLTPDALEKLLMEGWYRDSRHAILNVWRLYEDISVPDITFYTKLNHSRLLTISLLWRPEIRSDIVDIAHDVSTYAINYASETSQFWTQYFRTEIYDSVMDIWFDAKPILQDFIDDIRDTEDLEEDIAIFKKYFKESYDNNEFYMQDIYKMYEDLAEEMSFRERMAHVPKIVNELWEIMGETGETIRQSILWLVESVKKVYNKAMEFIRDLMSGETIDQISEYLRSIAGTYDKMIRDLHISFLHYVENLWNETVNALYNYMSKTLKRIEPTFIQFAHYFESVFWEGSKKILEFLYARQSEIRTTVFAKNVNLTKNLDIFYEDITKNDFLTNVKKYARMLIDLIREQYFSSVPFGYELNEIGTEIVGEMKELYKLPFINFTMEITMEIYNKAKWAYEYLNMQDRMQQVIPLIYKAIIDYSHNALENELINHGARTKFVFEPDKGQIILEQKLPVPWHSFNESPNYEELIEYKLASKVQRFFIPSNSSFWTYYYKLAPLAEPSKWLPPFNIQALLIGNRHFVTFDGNHFDIVEHCSYLLSHDFMENTFSLVLQHGNNNGHQLVLLVNNSAINIDLENKVVTLNGDNYLHLPLQIDDTYIYAEESIVNIQNKKGFGLFCNFKHEVCTFELSGWYFGKVAGLLGMMDNEPRTDYYSSTAMICANFNDFIDSWRIGSCTKIKQINPNFNKLRNNSSIQEGICPNIFHAKSPFSECYSIIDPTPFARICNSKSSLYKSSECTSAYAYMTACKNKFIPLRMPPICVICPLPYGEYMQEGDFVKMEDDGVPQSTDVIFIMEAKECNQYMRDRRMVHTFVTILSKELSSVGIKKNRYAVITYGGDGVFDQPHNIVVNNEVFTNEHDLPNYFEKITSGNGNTDIFAALKYATKLQYRAGISKTFILIPCSDCDMSNMTVDYNALNQAFLEQNVTLHVLMNADFDFEKLRVSKMFYGLDSERAFTKSDFKVLKGDMDLRRQIKLTRSMMGYCTTLALETNGTIFTGKKMGSENLALVKKFSSVFARRIAASAQPDSCQSCECIADGNGIDFVECVPCSIPVPAYSDFDFQENGTLSTFWPTLEPFEDHM